MRITQAVRIRGQRYRLSFEDAPDAEIDRRTFDEAGYAVGSVLTQEEWEALAALSEQNRLRERALYLLAGRSYGKKELARKLARPARGSAANAEAADATAQRMEQLGLVDDAAYAALRARDMQRGKLYPRRRIAAELAAKGLDRELIRQTVQQLDAEDEEIACLLLQKKYPDALRSDPGRRKAAAALLRRGFAYEDVRRALLRCAPDGEQPEETWL